MLKIAVCDDDPIFLDEVRGILPGLSQVEAAGFYLSPGELLEQIRNGAICPDLILMDIQFENDHTGLHWAEALGQLAPRIGVICVTGYNDRYAQQVLLHKINLIGYLTKPLDPAMLSRYLDKALEQQSGRGYLTFISRGKTYSVSTDAILYLESRNHTVILHTQEETFEFYEKLSQLCSRLPGSFAQCHKSYLVNLDQITRLEPSSLVLSCGTVIPVSKTFHVPFQEAFFHHIGQHF